MRLHLRNVVPDFIETENRKNSHVWSKKISITQGEHLHIVAPSGSGKTSIIHFMYGLRKDFSGEILYDEINIKNLSTEGFSTYRQKKISIIFQDLRLFGDQTAKQNIEIKRILDPYHPSVKIDEMAQRLGIATKLHQPLITCSYGEQQRVAIIRALMQPFDFILLDEPYSHLDEENRKKAMELIYEECAKRNATMIFADLKPLDLLQDEKIIFL